MAGTTGNTPRSRALGAALRNKRNARFKGSLRAFAKLIGVSHSMVSKWENGEILPTPEQVGIIVGALGIVGDEREQLIEEAKAARDPDWMAPGVDRQVSALRGFEDDAVRAVFVSQALPSGMLQTESTARAILAGANLTEKQVDAIVDARMSRKEALLRSDPLELLALIGTRALTRTLGGVDVATDQLRYLLKMSKLPHVTVRAVPEIDDFNPIDMGPFVLYEFKVGDPIVYFEHHRSSMFAPKRDVPDMVKAVDRIEEIAMSPESTSELIANAIKRMETTP